MNWATISLLSISTIIITHVATALTITAITCIILLIFKNKIADALADRIFSILVSYEKAQKVNEINDIIQECN